MEVTYSKGSLNTAHVGRADFAMYGMNVYIGELTKIENLITDNNSKIICNPYFTGGSM